MNPQKPYQYLALALFITISSPAFLLNQSKNTVRHQDITTDSTFQQRLFGIGLSLGEGTGMFGGKISYHLSTRWWLTAGFGYYYLEVPSISIFGLTTGSTSKKEYSVLVTPKYYFLKSFYFTTGISVKIKEGSLTNNGISTSVSVNPIGIPLAAGIEFRNLDGTSFHVEAGYAQYFGNGANDIDLVITNGTSTTKTTLAGSSGAWIGIGVVQYF